MMQALDAREQRRRGLQDDFEPPEVPTGNISCLEEQQEMQCEPLLDPVVPGVSRDSLHGSPPG
jgi:hypothetical protein